MSAGGPTLLFTGFPGFIGARLLPRLLELRLEARLACLVQERFLGAAQASVSAIQAAHTSARGRIDLVPGDITLPGLGIEPGAARSLRERLVGAYHLAAVYDLAVAGEVAQRINVEGTRNLLRFVSDAGRFERLEYVSTAYVSGGATGVFRETDLDIGQSFRNRYEETKFLAEVEVVGSGVPFVVYRPGIVVGDSRTGETAKFDGPYFVLAAMDKMPSPGLFLRIGRGRNTVNLVPVDFVIEALARLSASPASAGKTYHLTDPQPLSTLEIARLFARALGKQLALVPVPLALAQLFFSPRAVQRYFGMPVESLAYFDHACHYDNHQTEQDLGRLGVQCPRLPDYVERLVAFYREKRGSVRSQAMI